MLAQRCTPDGITNIALMRLTLALLTHAETTGGHWEKASECFNQMLAQGCTPDGITYSALITALERGEQWRHALQAFHQMTGQGCHPDSVVYNALLEVCWRSGVLGVQMRAAHVWTLANRSGHFRWVLLLVLAVWQ